MRKNLPIRKLGEVCHLVRGPFGGSLKKSCFVDLGYAVYEQKHAIYDEFQEIRYFINDQKFEEMKRFELLTGDLIMSCSGTMGKVAVVPDGIQRGIINQALLKLTPSKALKAEYLKHWIESPNFQNSLEKYSKGAAIKNITSVKVLKEIEVPCPSLCEQESTIDLLLKAFAAIGQAKAKIEKNIENAKELFQAKLNAIFTQKGEGWEEKRFDDICDFTRGPFGGSLKKSCFVDEGYAIYEQQHAIYNQFSSIRYFVDNKKFNEMKRFELRPGDLIMSCSGTMGKVAIVPEEIKKGIINQALLKLTPKGNIQQTFLKKWMESTHFYNEIAKHSKGAAIKNVASVKVLKEIMVPYTDIEQQKIVSINISRLESQVLKVIETYEKKVTDLEELKKSILQKAFSSELTQKYVKETVI